MNSPNILVMCCHDLGQFLHCYGVPTVQTPNIDGLAQAGVIFKSSFCAAPQCSPSRASLYTGLYPHSNGVMGLTHANFAWDFHPEVKHVGQLLHDAGYTTALLGVHHESRGGGKDAVAKRCGMDEYVPGGRADHLADLAIERLQRYSTQRQPFYLQVGFREPHRLPMNGDQEETHMGFLGNNLQPDASLGTTVPGYLRDTEDSRTEMAEIQAAVRFMDEAVGRILAALCNLGMEENTLVVFTTDHGLALPRAKCTLYDPGVEVALIMRYPARNWHGEYHELVSNVDIVPTLLDVVGVPASNPLQGRSFLPLLENREYACREAVFTELTYHEYYDPCRSIRTHRYKYIMFFSAAPAYMDCSQSYHPRTKPVVPPHPRRAYHPVAELYDLQNDPWEQQNLAGKPEVAVIEKQLRHQLHQWMIETDDPLLHGPIPSPMHRWAMEQLLSAD